MGLTIGDAIFITNGLVALVVLVYFLSKSKYKQSSNCVCRNCTNFKDCPVGKKSPLLIFENLTIETQKDKNQSYDVQNPS